MSPRRVAIAGTLAAMLGCSRVSAQALLRFQPGAGELGTDSRGSWTRYGDGRLSRSLELAGWVAVPIGGALLDPTFLSWRATLRPELRRTQYTGAPELLRGSGFNWSGSAQLLGGRPVNLLIDGGRGRTLSDGGFGIRSETRTSSLGSTLTWQNSWFPVLLSWRRQSTANDWRSELSRSGFETAFDTRTLRLSGASTKTTLLVERTLQDDRTGPVDFAGWAALLTHTGRWGKGSSLESSYELADQSGAFGFQRRQWSERLHLQHTRSVASNWSWRRARTAATGQSSRLTTISGEAVVELGRRLSGGLLVARDGTRFGQGRERASLVQPRLSLDWPLARQVRLSAQGSLGYQWRELEGAAELRVPVAAERHLVPPSRRFTLDLPDADPTTVVIRREDQSIVYDEGADYFLAIEGSVVRVDIPPQSRILVGETLSLSYRARLAGDFADQAVVGSVNAAFSAGPLQLQHRASRRSSAMPSARADALGYGEHHLAHTTLGLRLAAGPSVISLDAGHLRRRRAGDDTREHSLGATLSTRDGRRVGASLGAFYSRITTNAVTVTSLSGRGTLGWTIAASLRVLLTADLLQWRDDRGLDDRFAGGAFDLEWRLGQIETILRAEHQRRLDGSSYVLNRISLHSVRRF